MRARGFAAFASVAMLAAYATSLEGQQQPAGRQNPPAAGPAAEGLRVPLQTDEDGQPANLPALPSGMTQAMIRQGDSLYHGKAGCNTCHNNSGTGVPAGGSGLTGGLAHIPTDWRAIDSLVTEGLPESKTRTPVAMPGRGAQSNLTPEETRLVSAYVWAIATVRGEPWRPGGRERTRAQIGAPGAQAAAPAAAPTKAADTSKAATKTGDTATKTP